MNQYCTTNHLPPGYDIVHKNRRVAKCSKCSARLDSEASFCHKCGAPLVAAAIGALVMPYINGVPFAELSCGRLGLETWVEIAVEVAAQLKSMHGVGIVHQDIKGAHLCK